MTLLQITSDSFIFYTWYKACKFYVGTSPIITQQLQRHYSLMQQNSMAIAKFGRKIVYHIITRNIGFYHHVSMK